MPKYNNRYTTSIKLIGCLHENHGLPLSRPLLEHCGMSWSQDYRQRHQCSYYHKEPLLKTFTVSG